MSRLSMVDPANASPEARATLAALQSSLGSVPNMFRVAAHSPATMRALLQMSATLSRGSFSAKTRESIALVVAQENGCDYCLSAHTTLARAAGLSDAEIARARIVSSAEPLTQGAISLAAEIVSERGKIGTHAIQRAIAAGITEAHIVETLGFVALNILTNYLNIVADTDIDYPVIVRASERTAV